MSRASSENFVATIVGLLGLLDETVLGFLNTEVPICRPRFEFQSLHDSGHKDQHALTHLAIVWPNYLFGAVFAGVLAAGGDAALCIQVGLSQRLPKLLGPI